MFNNFTPKQIIMYIIAMYILKYVLYFIADYYENYKYPEEERVYKYTNNFTLMNKILDTGKNIMISTGLMNDNTTEGFQTYQQCRDLGYSKEFCVQTPISVFGPAGCMCRDGSMGATYPGLRGGCLCNTSGVMKNVGFHGVHF